MALLDIFKKSPVITPIKGIKNNQIALFSRKLRRVEEAAKGVVSTIKNTFALTNDIGEKHPFDMKQMEQIYNSVPIIQGGINKIVDFSVGPGFRVSLDDERAEEITKTFMKELDFDNLLRKIIQDMIVYGNAYIEIVKANGTISQLIPRNPSTMYVRRDEKGKILGYSQVPNKIMKPIIFNENEIAHFKLGKTGDTPYGISIIQPLMTVLTRKLALEKHVETISERKANAPYDITVGDVDNHASDDDVTNVRQMLEDLQNDHEWVHGHLVKVEALGFKDKVMDLNQYLDYFENQIIYGLEVPMVLLGKGNIPEGLASVQLETFERKITSIQLAVEQILETKILPPVLKNQGFENLVIEFEWKEASDDDKQKQVQTMLQIIGLASAGTLDPDLYNKAQDKLKQLLDFEEDTNDTDFVRRPQLPGQAQKKKTKLSEDDFDVEENFVKPYVSISHEELYELPLQEFIGFNYTQYLQQINIFIDSDKFVNREYQGFKFVQGTHQQDWEETIIKYSLKDNMTKRQINKLKKVLKESLQEGKSINHISQRIRKEVKPSNMIIRVPEQKDDYGQTLRKSYKLHVDTKQRSLSMARTETIRASNQGALNSFEELKVERVQWISTPDGRVCPYCESQNGKVLTINEADEMIPSHDLCRCSWIPITE